VEGNLSSLVVGAVEGNPVNLFVVKPPGVYPLVVDDSFVGHELVSLQITSTLEPNFQGDVYIL